MEQTDYPPLKNSTRCWIGGILKTIKLRKFLQASLILVALALTWGCGGGGGGGGGGNPTPPVNKAPAVTIISSGGGEFVIQGDNMDGVAGIDLTIAYDSSKLSSPTVTEGALTSGKLFAVNTDIPGTIRMAIVSTTALSGSGQIAKISFATHDATTIPTLNSVKLIDANGNVIQ
jgi:hypothetical protein